jgi:predicted NAD-dependent protein-ADP-ribosyltransferase YbiA (DUF1768 family)
MDNVLPKLQPDSGISEGIPCKDTVKGVMTFFFKKKEGISLSNFWKGEVVIEDRHYDSGESCFHGEKFFRLGTLYKKRNLIEYSRAFLNDVCNKPGEVVKKMGRALILNKDELNAWSTISIDVQREICKYKYDHYQEVRDDLRKSKGKILIHPAMRCSVDKVKDRLWEGRAILVDGKIQVIGQNMLGKLWMELA